MASYIFYAAFDWRFTFLLLAQTLICFFCAKNRKNALAGSTNGFPPNLPLFDSLFIPVKKISLAYQDIDMGKVIEELKNV